MMKFTLYVFFSCFLFSLELSRWVFWKLLMTLSSDVFLNPGFSMHLRRWFCFWFVPKDGVKTCDSNLICSGIVLPGVVYLLLPWRAVCSA